MAKIKQINILDIIELYGKEECQSILSTFLCPINKDVEDFIHNKAINFSLQRIAITFLVFAEKEEQLFWVGYYTLAHKFVSVSAGMLSKTLQKRIAKFSQYDIELERYLVSMPLIAQLGKNFAYQDIDTGFTGTDLLTCACKRVLQAQRLIGGKMTYIECEDNPKLKAFYAQNEFCQFGEREKESGELTDSAVLIQMLRYFKN